MCTPPYNSSRGVSGRIAKPLLQAWRFLSLSIFLAFSVILAMKGGAVSAAWGPALRQAVPAAEQCGLAVSVSLKDMWATPERGNCAAATCPHCCPPFFVAVNGFQRTPMRTKNRKSPLCSRRCGLLRTLLKTLLAEREGFEPSIQV